MQAHQGCYMYLLSVRLYYDWSYSELANFVPTECRNHAWIYVIRNHTWMVETKWDCRKTITKWKGYAYCWSNYCLHFWFTEVTVCHLLQQMIMPLKQWIVLHMKIVTTKLQVRIILTNTYYSILKIIPQRILMISQLMSLITLVFSDFECPPFLHLCTSVCIVH